MKIAYAVSGLAYGGVFIFIARNRYSLDPAQYWSGLLITGIATLAYVVAAMWPTA